MWGGGGGDRVAGAARLFSIPAARPVQYACNNRNFANRTATGPSPLLPRQPKPQSHTKVSQEEVGDGRQA